MLCNSCRGFSLKFTSQVLKMFLFSENCQIIFSLDENGAFFIATGILKV